MMELKDYIQIIDLLNLLDSDFIIIKNGDRNLRIVHLVGETVEMQTHDLVESPHRIVIVLCQRLPVNRYPLAIEDDLLFKYLRGLRNPGRAASQGHDSDLLAVALLAPKIAATTMNIGRSRLPSQW